MTTDQTPSEHAADTVARSDALDVKIASEEPRYVVLPAGEYIRRKVIDGLLAVIIVFLIVGFVADRISQHRAAQAASEQREQLLLANERLAECTTPGPRAPTPDDPSTGHPCYDQGTARTGQAIAAIVDANGNGCPDVIEILNLLDPAHPQTCGPPPTTTTTAPPATSGGSTSSGPHASTTTTSPPRTTTTVRRPPPRQRHPMKGIR